ncbi:hypothetical protein Avbf_16423 [Armadillidium vulgare]|nr:hypothetical protein Avbf_16423 [Armadillidium vulgare]
MKIPLRVWSSKLNLYKYKEDLSDDEDLRIDMGGGGPSESEDIWDDWRKTREEEEENKITSSAAINTTYPL